MPSETYIRNQIAGNLERMARFLANKQLVVDIGPLMRAAALCRNSSVGGGWEYRVDRLRFQPKGSLKSDNLIDSSTLTVELSVNIGGLCEPEDDNDPLTKLELDIVVFAQGDTGQRFISAWHLDRHEDDPQAPASFFHPQYHIHFGGRQLTAGVNGNYGSILVLDTPRLAYPPLEALLGIDFILTNFFEINQLKGRAEGEYTNLIRPMQEKMWKFYAGSIHGFWQPNAHEMPWNPSTIWPQLL